MGNRYPKKIFAILISTLGRTYLGNKAFMGESLSLSHSLMYHCIAQQIGTNHRTLLNWESKVIRQVL